MGQGVSMCSGGRDASLKDKEEEDNEQSKNIPRYVIYITYYI